MNLKSITVEFECGHERNNQLEYEENKYCLICKKTFSQENKCKDTNHALIKKEDLYFYCKAHLKKYGAYCEKCKINLCENCECAHNEIKNNYEYYFSLSQLEELLSLYNIVRNYTSSIYSLNCKDNVCQEFEIYYSAYMYLKNNELFHSNIISDISLFYEFFKFLINSKFEFNGCLSICEINTVNDNTIFYDSRFKKEYNELLDMKEFNFDNLMILFSLSKRYIIDKKLFDDFSNKIYSYISNKILKFNDIEKNIFKLNIYLKLFREGISNKESEITKAQNDIQLELIDIKLPKKAIPLYLKTMLLKRLQREIIKKYIFYLHKVKPNLFIINNIKKKYDFLKQNNNKLYTSLNLEAKVKELDNIKLEDNNNFIDIVYFEKDFEFKNLLNTFIYFTQIIQNESNNEIIYLKNNNEVLLNFLNKNNNCSKQLNSEINNNSINTNNNFLKRHNKPIENEELKNYENYLNELKINFRSSYKYISVKETINLTDIVNALFKNDFSELKDFSEKNEIKDNSFDNLINECLSQLTNIKIKEDEEDENEKQINYFYSKIKNNIFQEIGDKIFSSLMKNRKYKNILIKIKENFDNNNIDKNEYLYLNLLEVLIKLGGFDEIIAEQIIKIIKNYLSNKNELINLEKSIQKNKLFFNQNWFLSIEIGQLKKIKNYIYKINEELNEDSNYTKEIEIIKESFEKNFDKCINNNIDNKFQKVLEDIKKFIKGKDIETILESLKNIIKNIKCKFSFDNELDLISYCWGIQNGHDYIIEYKNRKKNYIYNLI